MSLRDDMKTDRRLADIIFELIDLQSRDQSKELFSTAEAALALYPDNIFLLSLLGQTAYLQGKTAAAIAYYEKVIALVPNHGSAHYHLAILLYRIGQTDDAISHLRLLIAQDSDFTMAYFWLGTLYSRAGNLVESVESFKKFLARCPSSKIANNHIIETFLLMKKQDAALPYADAIIRDDLDDPRAMYNAGQIYFKCHKMDQAVAAFKKGLEKNPFDQKCRTMLELLTDVQEP